MAYGKGENKQAWEPMTLKSVGQIRDIVEGGKGKESPVTGDPGDDRKPPGSE